MKPRVLKWSELTRFRITVINSAIFRFDTDSKILKLDCVVPNFRLEFDYEINGQILQISVYGKGSGWGVYCKFFTNFASV